MEKIMIAMSGGVDSAVAALLLKEQGFDCAGGTMRLTGGVSDKAAASAETLGLPFYLFDCAGEFEKYVIAPFIEAYRGGRTPNPCVGCNRLMKFGVFMRRAQDLGFNKIATGHYARTGRSGGRVLLKKGLDPAKDQSYYLYALTQEQLARAVFPLGGLRKEEVRGLARDAGLAAAAAAGDSQDICFIPDGDYAAFIGGCLPGRFFDSGGNDLGGHRGIIHYTVGQRRGLGLAHTEPLYVKEIRAWDNAVVVGTSDELYSKTVSVGDCNLIALDSIDTPLRAWVKIRYRHAEQPALVRQTGERELEIEFDQPQRAAAPGQSAVIYDGDVVIGGGVITPRTV
jgi:tRNA-specific 2-thiouridylase